ncbi:FeoB-associated Cys-rich membrane protein [Dysosmobacter sp. NSJ-60]|nr:FeoB-associated Cys-rich membrane protein [Pusillibacter faecalis]MBC5746659.1 FeoB-associated Cys-rich membrane protein [Dysosmobacter hominis]MBS5657962.1 FeoB-associated Cys-rich membrane protein [Oscillibacter sp.]MCQ5025315.1 FeoB-associated Cys-rich membrane protein [Oscillibacter valericigenes]
MFGNIVVILALVAAVTLAVRSLWNSHRNGGGCGGDCSNCGSCGGCRSK